jgi:ADP-heptose:LPS heptosyltransferase
MRILIINLTRLGDLVQTMPLVNGLRAKYPDAEIDFLAMKDFTR